MGVSRTSSLHFPVYPPRIEEKFVGHEKSCTPDDPCKICRAVRGEFVRLFTAPEGKIPEDWKKADRCAQAAKLGLRVIKGGKDDG